MCLTLKHDSMIISVTSLKGGVGKSTVAQNLAVLFAHAGWKVCIVDVDTNQSCLRWSSYRDEKLPSIPVYGLTDGSVLAANIKHLNNDFDIVIIDGTPALNALTSKIILLADMLFIPICAGIMDTWATEKFLLRYQDAVEEKGEDIPAFFMMNKHKPKTTLSIEIMAELELSPIPVMETSFRDRVAYGEAVISGKGVYEYKDQKAKMEVERFFNEVTDKINKIWA